MLAMFETITTLAPPVIRTADDVSAEAIRIFGDLPGDRGVLQVAA
jgi:hypothetical protein